MTSQSDYTSTTTQCKFLSYPSHSFVLVHTNFSFENGFFDARSKFCFVFVSKGLKNLWQVQLRRDSFCFDENIDREPSTLSDSKWHIYTPVLLPLINHAVIVCNHYHSLQCFNYYHLLL